MLSKFSVKKPYTVIVGVVAVLILGYVAFTKMQTDLLPSINLPYMIVMTTYPGASPEEVEQVVTKPIEQAVATVNQIKNYQSVSSENMSMVIMEFGGSANMDTATIDVREGIDMISGSWPEEVGSATVLKLNPDMMPVMVAAIDAEGLSNVEVSKLANEKWIPRLESVEGVASVNASGLIEEKVNVILRQDKIDQVNDDIKEAVSKQFDKAEKKIEKAEKKLEDGKDDLGEKRNEFVTGMSEAEIELLNGRMELVQAEIQMANGEKELAAQEAELKKGKKTLADQRKELEKNEKTIRQSKKTAEDGLKQINAGLAEVDGQIANVEAGIATIQQQLQGANEVVAAALNEKLIEAENGLALLQATKKQLTDQKGQVESGLKEIESGMAQLQAGKKELNKAAKKIETGEAAIKKAKREMQEGKRQIDEGKERLDEGQKQLEEQKDNVGQELDNASSAMVQGEKELTTQTDAMDDTKKDAIKNADMADKITMDMVKGVLTAQNFSMPAGYYTEEGKEYMVRVGDKVADENELANLILFDMGMDDVEPITLSDVADVALLDNSDVTYAKVNGNDGVMLTIQKQNNYATAEVSENLHERFGEISKEEDGVSFTALMDQGTYIDLVVGSVLDNLIWGGILAVIILILFLWDLRPTGVVALSIPFSVVFALVMMYFSGVTLNVISLSGLAVGVGMLVDNSIVVIENIYRMRHKGIPIVKAAVNGATQVAGAIASSTLTTVCVFLPIVFVEGMVRQLFVDMALTILYSLMASLIVALTFVPMMSSLVLKRTKEKKHRIMNVFYKIYDVCVRFVLRWKFVALLAAIGLFVLSIYLSFSKGTSFMPEMDSPQIDFSVESLDEWEFEDEAKAADAVMERVQQVEGVDTVGVMVGQSGGMGMLGGGGGVSGYVILKEDKTKSSQEIANEIEEKCKDLEFEVSANGSSMDMSALGGSGVAVNVKGEDLDVLQTVAKDVAAVIEGVDGTMEVSDGNEEPSPEIRIHVDKEKAMEKGLTVAQVFADVRTLLTDSTEATTLTMKNDEFTVEVSRDDAEVIDRAAIEAHKFKVTDREGKEKNVKFADVATIEDAVGFSSISRLSGQRQLTVSAAVEEGHNVGLVGTAVEEALEDFDVPDGYELEFSGENASINEAMSELVKMLLLAIALIYLVMVAQFQSLLSPFIVMFTIPLAFTGGLLGLYFTGNDISVISVIGFVILSGVVVNNGIVLVDYINQLRAGGMDKREAIVEAGVTRMRPILMTALTTITAMVMMVFGEQMGAEMMRPVAIVSIFGLTYATFMTLFIVPSVYDLLNRRKYKVITDDEMELVGDEVDLAKES